MTKSKLSTLKLFAEAAKRIPAYKDFLRKNSIKPERVKTILDFEKVPFTSKENYIFKYPLKDRCWDSRLDNSHTIAASSGSTGEPVFWPRDLSQEFDGALIHEHLLESVFDISKHKTLFVNSFGLGNWIAGIYTEFCLYLLRLKGVQFTLASPGYNQEETFKIIKNFSRYYDQTVIACHPPILKMMIENGVSEGISWNRLNVRFLGAGEGFSENWRDYLLSLVGQKDVWRTIINIYGSADAGLMGFETPLSILLHRLTSVDHELNKKVFRSDRNPYLYQYDPRFKYLETNSDSEILITAQATAPLLRYNIHDSGQVLSFSEVFDKSKVASPKLIASLAKSRIKTSQWNLPFVAVFGRDKFMTSLYGVNIYPENIKAVLEHQSLQNFLTGRFECSKKADSNQDQYLLLNVEMRPGVSASDRVSRLLVGIFVDTLKTLNSEYKYVESRYGNKMHPVVNLRKFQDRVYFAEGKIKKMS